MDVQKNPKGSLFYIFRHYATSRGLQKNSPQFSVFWEVLSPVVEKVVFESYWALDMAPTWAVPGLFVSIYNVIYRLQLKWTYIWEIEFFVNFDVIAYLRSTAIKLWVNGLASASTTIPAMPERLSNARVLLSSISAKILKPWTSSTSTSLNEFAISELLKRLITQGFPSFADFFNSVLFWDVVLP